MNDLVKVNNSQFSIKNDFIALREPNNIEEVEKVIKMAMKINRIARFSIGYHLTVPEWHQKFLDYLTTLALKYRPWQFRWVSQESGSVEVSWVEVDEWLNKYEGESK